MNKLPNLKQKCGRGLVEGKEEESQSAGVTGSQAGMGSGRRGSCSVQLGPCGSCTPCQNSALKAAGGRDHEYSWCWLPGEETWAGE